MEKNKNWCICLCKFVSKAMSSRRSEIELKRQRLQELRKQREEKDLVRKSRDSLGGLESRRSSQLHSALVSNGEVSGSGLAGGVSSNGYASTEKKTVYSSISVQTDPIEEESTTVPSRKETITYNKATQTIDFEALYKEEEDEIAKTQHEIREQLEEPIVEEVPVESKIIDDQTLAQFFQESFQIINRTIEDDKDVLQNYSTLKKLAIEEEQPYILLDHFSFDNNDGIFSIDSSRFFPELLILSNGYSIYIYNTKFQKFEHHFKSTTKILNIQFSQFQSNFIFGTGFNGKIMIWNLETTLSQPYLESAVSLETHAYPVWCLDQVKENMGVLITGSTDGRILTWDPQLLSKPSSQHIELSIPKKLGIRYDELTPLHMVHLEKEHGLLIIGSEDGHIYKVKRFDNKGKSNSDALIDKIYDAHKGPITGLSTSPEWPTLFISSSLDWNLYLWDTNLEEPLLQIYKSEAILGCQWRPNHPTQFGYIYEDIFEILDLSVDSVIPVLKLTAGETLNKVLFDKDGSKVYLTTLTGHVFIYELLLDDVKSDISKFKRNYIKS